MIGGDFLRMGCVYVLQNKLNGKVYVGQTVKKVAYRIADHKKSLRPIGRAIRKYGFENFTCHENEVPEPFLDNLEANLICLYDSLCPNGYNFESGGNLLKHHHSSSKEKMSASRKGKKQSQETRLKRSESMKGMPHPWAKGKTNQGIQAARKAWIGMHHTNESKAIMSVLKKGKPAWNKGISLPPEKHPMFGKHHTEATKKKISEARMGQSSWNKGLRKGAS